MALLIYYSSAGREHVESLLQRHGLRPHSVDGRAGDAAEEIRRHPAELVAIDSESQDISITQAVRQIGRLLPRSLVFTVHHGPKAAVYRAGRLVGQVENSCIAHFATTFEEPTDEVPRTSTIADQGGRYVHV